MATNTVNVTGSLVAPNGSTLTSGSVIFQLSDYDLEAGTSEVVTGKTVEAVISATGKIDIDLWPNLAGSRGTIYIVTLVRDDVGGPVREHLGVIQLADTEAADLSDLLDMPDIVPGSFWTRLNLTEADVLAVNEAAATAVDAAATAVDAASVAQTSAVAAGAEIFADTFLGIASTTNGDLFYVPTNGGLDIYRNDAGVAVYVDTILGNVGGSSGGEAFYATRSALVSDIASGATFAQGEQVVAGGISYLSSIGATAIPDLPGLLPFGDTLGEHFGMVADGVDTGTAFTGTDNSAAYQTALNYCSSIRDTLRFGGGNYVFNAAANAEFSTVVTAPTYVDIDGGGNTVFMTRDNLAIANKVPRFFMASVENEPGIAIGSLYERMGLRHIEIRGEWSHQALLDSDDIAQTVMRTAGYKVFEALNVTIKDCRGIVFNSGANGLVHVEGCIFERIASDTCRFLNSNDITITGNTFRHTDDDAVSFHSRDESPVLNPTKSRAVVSNNIFEDCESIQLLGPHTLIFTDNVITRPRGSGINLLGVQGPEGSSAVNSIVCTDNIIQDALTHYFTSWPAQTNTSSWASIGGSEVIGVNNVTGGSVLGPLQASDAGPNWVNDVTDPSAPNSSGSKNIIFSRNVLSRTLPVVAAYSDWGFGPMFNRSGWVDPEVVENSFKKSMLAVFADATNCTISENIFEGSQENIGVYFAVPGYVTLSKNAFRNVKVTGNTFHNLSRGIDSGLGTSAGFAQIDVEITGNKFDLDPYYKQPARNSDGSWDEVTVKADIPSAINLFGWEGFRLSGNTYQNCYSPYLPLSWDSLQNHASFGNEMMRSKPAAVGYNLSNGGIANILRAGDAIKYTVIETNTASADWQALLNNCVVQSSAAPSSGIYVSGHVVQKHTPSVANGWIHTGWKRLTTGSGHVLGTDWAETHERVNNDAISGGGGITAETSGSVTAGAVAYAGLTSTPGQFDGGTTDPTATTRLNYNGNLVVRAMTSMAALTAGGFFTANAGSLFNGTVNLNGNRITNVGAATASGDAISLTFADGRYVRSVPTAANAPTGDMIGNMVSLTQAEYDAIAVKTGGTLYVIVG